MIKYKIIEKKVEPKTFKVKKTSKDLIHFIAQSLDVSQGEVIDLLLENFLPDEKTYDYLVSNYLEDHLSFSMIKSEVLDSFEDYVQVNELDVLEDENNEELNLSFLKTLERFIYNKDGIFYKFIEGNKKLSKLLLEQKDIEQFITIFPYITEEMYHVYQDIKNSTDINEKNLEFLNALAMKVNPSEYIAIRFDTTKPIVKSLVEKILNEDNELLILWKKFNLHIVSKYKNEYSFKNVYSYILDFETDDYVELIRILDIVLETVCKIAKPFQSEFFL
ncbi:MAG TPA: hypothetical protein VNR38_06150 [Ureibacillus sp.]|nr:hypothetical protein [Ureibacillus sp.]